MRAWNGKHKVMSVIDMHEKESKNMFSMISPTQLVYSNNRLRRTDSSSLYSVAQ
jgi:hypothetical protein